MLIAYLMPLAKANTWPYEGPDHLQVLGILAIVVREPDPALLTSDLLLLTALDPVFLDQRTPGSLTAVWEPSLSLVALVWLTSDLMALSMEPAWFLSLSLMPYLEHRRTAAQDPPIHS